MAGTLVKILLKSAMDDDRLLFEYHTAPWSKVWFDNKDGWGPFFMIDGQDPGVCITMHNPALDMLELYGLLGTENANS